MSWIRRAKPVNSPVAVADALGIGRRIEAAGLGSLPGLADELDEQFHRFRAKIPHRIALATKRRVYGTREFSTMRLNDMFILFSERPQVDFTLRYMVCASLLYHQLLLAGFLVRGGLGFGAVLRRGDMVLGAGFIDAYRMAEKRPAGVKDICAFLVSPEFLTRVANTERSWRLLCLYRDRFFINPRFLTAPDMGEFDNERILSLLGQAGADRAKLKATRNFLENLEDYDAAMLPKSRSRSLTGWVPRGEL